MQLDEVSKNPYKTLTHTLFVSIILLLQRSQQTGKDIEKNATGNKIWTFKKNIVPLLINAFYILPFLVDPDGQYTLVGVAMVAITGLVVTALISSRFPNGNSPATEPPEHTNSQPNGEAKKKFTLFFGMIYVFVAAIAVSQALETFNNEALLNMLSVDSIDEIYNMDARDLTILFTLTGFFVTAIAFVHAGVIYLATDATGELTKQKVSLVLQNFTVLFFQVVILFFMAFNISDMNNFIKLSIVLMLIDIIWVMRFMRTGNGIVHIEWLQFNLLVAVFLIIASLTTQTHSNPTTAAQQSLYTSIIIVAVLFCRTLCDYRALWKSVYSKRPLENF
jgi:hypothetical protein